MMITVQPGYASPFARIEFRSSEVLIIHVLHACVFTKSSRRSAPRIRSMVVKGGRMQRLESLRTG